MPHFKNEGTNSLKVDLTEVTELEQCRVRARIPVHLDLEPLPYLCPHINHLKREPKHQSQEKAETSIMGLI